MSTQNTDGNSAQTAANVLYVLAGVLVWSAAYLFAWFWWSFDPLLLLFYCVGIVAILGAVSYRFRWVSHTVPLWGEWVRFRRLQARKRGNSWLREVGLIPRANESNFRAFQSRQHGNMTLELTRVPVSDVALQKKASEYVGNYGARRFSYFRNGDTVRIVWFATDPLDEAFFSTPAVDVESLSVACARGENGDTVSISAANASGWLVAGMPGSGKSFSMRHAVFEPLDALPEVELTVLDCKGAADWLGLSNVIPFAPTASESDNLKTATEVIDSHLSEMKKRYDAGISNFWGMPLEERPPVKILLVDESHELFESSTDSTVKKLRSALASKVAAIVKQGRAAGVVCVLMTQKQTTDATPSNIRDNCGVRIAFRLATREAVIAAMGRDSNDGEASPLSIPNGRRGGAVLEIDGIRQHVRFMTPLEHTNGSGAR